VTAVSLDGLVWHGRDGRVYHARVTGGAVVFKPTSTGLRDLVRWVTGKSQYLVSKLLNAIFNATTYTPPATLYQALWTSALSASSTGASSGEASYTGYARVAVTANTSNYSTSTAGSATTNSVAITFGTNAGSLQTVTYFAILDAASSGNILYWCSITSTAINPGDTPQIVSGAESITET
jgi:hypothetical protein